MSADSFDDEIQDDEEACPKCGHAPTRARPCSVLSCEDGWIDEYEDDAINFAPGEEYSMCEECHGTGIMRWCPNCGEDLNHPYWQKKRREAQAHTE